MVFTMANSEHVAKLREGVEAWNRWRMQLGNQLLVPDLIGADLSGADLVGANLHSTNLKDATRRHSRDDKSSALSRQAKRVSLPFHGIIPRPLSQLRRPSTTRTGCSR